MRSLLVAAALGLGLLSVGTTFQGAAAAPFHGRAPVSIEEQLAPVHYQRGYNHRSYGQPYYAPPPRHHWHRYAPPPPPHQSWGHTRPRQYGWR